MFIKIMFAFLFLCFLGRGYCFEINNPKKSFEFATEIRFSIGKDVVPSSAKKQIRKMFDKARMIGSIKSAKIISWGDKLRPKKKNATLSSGQLKLVEDRNDNLESVLERLDLHMVVRKISMAERPEVMDDLLAKDDKKIKKYLEYSDFSNESRSIVLFVIK
jgi:hypothetical protein